MPSDPFVEILTELSGKKYDSAADLEKAVVAVFNRHLEAFPPRYSYRDLLEWGQSKNWINREKDGYVVNVKVSGAV